MRIGGRGLIAVIFLISAVGGAGVMTVMQDSATDDVKVAVVVLDGADWTPISQLQRQGRLPTVSKYMEQGVYGNLSTSDAFSPVTWTKIGTGLDSSAVAISGWNTQTDDGLRMVRREDVRHNRIWNYLNAADIQTGVIGWLLTWPVEPVDGFMIAGPMRRSNVSILFPEEEFNHTESWRVRTESEWVQARIGLQRQDEVDFLAVGMKHLDLVQHHLWKFIEPAPFGMERQPEHDKYREFVYTEYENLDRVLSRFGPGWNVIVIGDSGFVPERVAGGVDLSYDLSVNPLIEAMGYGEFWTETIDGFKVWRYRDGTVLQKCPFRRPIGDVVNRTTIRFRLCVEDDSANMTQVLNDFRHITYRDDLPVGRKPLINRISYREETNDVIGYMNVYRDGFAAEQFRVEATNQILSNGEVPYIDVALGVTLPDGTNMSLWIGPEKSGDHPPGTSSIFIASGPAFSGAGRLPPGTISTTDIAPTVLYMYGVPIPRGMDGEVVDELFTDQFNNQHTITYTNQSTQRPISQMTVSSKEGWTAALERRLRSMGYHVR